MEGVASHHGLLLPGDTSVASVDPRLPTSMPGSTSRRRLTEATHATKATRETYRAAARRPGADLRLNSSSACASGNCVIAYWSWGSRFARLR